MNEGLLPFGAGAQAFIVGYLLSLILIGWLGYRARRDSSLRDFYLAGKGVGFFVLVLTLYATQYSGNTLFGFTGKTYRIGYSWGMCIHFMTAIVVCFLMLAPRLYARSRERGYITPADFLQDRFGNLALTVVAAGVMVVAISNFLLGQLMAMGRALQGLTGLEAAQAYTWGVISLATIIVVYETLGGFRAVAWTDSLQGGVLLVGFGILCYLIFEKYGSLGEATKYLLASPPDGPPKILPPDAGRIREWYSYIFIVGFGGALYPQGIQRIYAARSAQVLRRSLRVMAFLPLTTTLIAVIVGIMAAANVPGLSNRGETDAVLTIILREIQQESLFGYWLVAVLFAGVLAAIMSTADSVLLSISSMLTKDIYGRCFRPAAPEKELTYFGKICSWVLIAILSAMAIALRDETTLVGLLDRKFDLLVQLVPGFFLGLHWHRLRGGAVLFGLLAGVSVSVALAAAGYGKLYDIHAGLYGLSVNLCLAVGGSLAPITRESANSNPR